MPPTQGEFRHIPIDKNPGLVRRFGHVTADQFGKKTTGSSYTFVNNNPVVCKLSFKCEFHRIFKKRN